jgi:hypothetical protein
MLRTAWEWCKKAFGAWGLWNDVLALFDLLGGWKGLAISALMTAVTAVAATKAEWWWPYACIGGAAVFF